MANVIDFAVIDDDSSITVVPIIDGTSLIALVAKVEQHFVSHASEQAGSYQGLPIKDIGQITSTASTSRHAVLASLEHAQSQLETTVHTDAETVHWSQFGNPEHPLWSYVGLGPFEFDRAQYESAVAQVAVPLTMGEWDTLHSSPASVGL